MLSLLSLNKEIADSTRKRDSRVAVGGGGESPPPTPTFPSCIISFLLLLHGSSRGFLESEGEKAGAKHTVKMISLPLSADVQ